MKTKIKTVITIILLLCTCPVIATTWTSGHHEIYDGDEYWEVEIYNDVTVDIFGGKIGSLWTFDTTLTNWYAGQMIELRVRDDSIVNIYGGSLDILGASENSLVNLYSGNLSRLGIEDNSLLNLYAYDVVCYPTGGLYDRGWIEGRYISSDLYFNIDFVKLGTCSHINIVPEPTALILFGLGGLFLRKKKLEKIP